MWEAFHREIYQKSGQEWDLLAGGILRDPNHSKDYESYLKQIEGT